MGSLLNAKSIKAARSQNEGGPPEEYNKVLDRTVVQTVVERLELLAQVLINDKAHAVFWLIAVSPTAMSHSSLLGRSP